MAVGLLLLVYSQFLAGCRQRPKPQGPQQPAKDANQVLATVNGIAITADQIEPMVQQWMAGFADRIAQWTPQYVEQRRKEKIRQLVDQLIVEHLLDQQAIAKGIVITDAQVDQAIAQMAGQMQPSISTAEYLAKVRQSGRDIGQLREQIKRQLAREQVCEDAVAGKLDVPDQEALDYYNTHKEQFQEPEQVRASHILLKPDPSSKDPNQARAGLISKAEQLLAQIKAGADFSELARTHSQCPSASKDGDLGYFKRGEMEAAFEKMAFELPVGQVGGPVQTSYGVHIIKALDHRQAYQLTFDQAKDRIIQTLANQRRQQLLREYIDSLRSTAEIEYNLR